MSVSDPDASNAIREGENALRDLIAEVLGNEVGENWLEASGLTPDRIKEFEARRAEEQKGRNLQVVEQRLLYYADLHDLQKIVDKHWERFKSLLREKKEFDVYIEKLADLRNPDAHQRGLWPYEVALAVGISGHFRQALAFSRRQVDTDKYYPRFDRVTDNFGNTLTSGGLGQTVQQVRAGDDLTYRISAWNPHPEPLEFEIHTVGSGKTTGWRTEELLSLRLEPADIKKHVFVEVRLRSERSKKLNLGHDETIVFGYVGIP